MIPKIENILFATDYSENSRISIDWAIALSQKHGARLLVLHVLEDVAAIAPNIQMYFTDEEWEKMKERNEKDAVGKAKERLQSFCDEVQACTTECEYVADEILVRRGMPIDEIIGAAEEHHCDIIVIGTAGGRKLTDIIMGSTARGVLRRSAVPVLSIPMTEQKA